MTISLRLTMVVVGVVAVHGRAAAQDTIPPRLPAVVVTRDAGAGRSPLDLPYAITTVRPDSLAPGQAHTQVEQTLGSLPGVTVANRANPSQDARLSIRGFGARSPFGVRSIRVLRDGMPLTLPDGQTPIDYLDLEAVGHVEIIRGTASSLYGNASGGVVDLRTAPPPRASAALQGRSWTGSNGLQRHAALLGGSSGVTNYTANVGRTSADGARAHARQRLTNAFARASTVAKGTAITVVGLALDMPLAENPGALTRAQFDSAPHMADPINITRNARKEVRQAQLGVSALRPLGGGGGDALAQVFGGTRSLYNPLAFAVVGIDRASGGASLRATLPVTTGTLTHRVSAGVDAQRMSDARRNWSNCNGVTAVTANCPTLGTEQGRLQIDQREIVTSVGPYVRGETEMAGGRVRGTLAVRADATTFEVRDAFLTDGRDDSGTRTMRAVSPMAGVVARLAALHAVYANVSTAFETPTTTELGNQPDGTAGLNADLDPQYATTYEVGAKGLLRTVQYDVALFTTAVRNELIQFEVPGGGGRTYFRNAGRTRRRGMEGALATAMGPASLHLAYTLSRFRFTDYQTGTSPQYAGNVIPGIPEHQLQANVTLRARDAFLVAEWLGKSEAYLNDANEATAPGFTVTNLRAGITSAFGRPWIRPVVGVQNLFDRQYAGSIAVNAAGTLTTAKFYEPSPGRTWIIGLSAATAPW
ncbi:MAG: TonB-dependent receptor [Gemmatimonadaceae bacterium]